jgi:hypothetical protein
MKKLKDICLGVLLNEGEEVVSLSPGEIDKVVDVSFDGEDIKIDFKTTYGKTANLVVKTSDFKGWVTKNKEQFKDLFKYFIIDFLAQSTEGDESLNEIVDDNGDIDLDGGMPNNSTNSMVTSPKFDLEKIYKSMVPKSIRFYSGDMGVGAVTW